MFLWQTLTLARVERQLGDDLPFGKVCITAVRDILYHIGLQHFPAPNVDVIAENNKNIAVNLIWSVDERQLLITVARDGVMFTQWENAFQIGSGGIDTKDSKEIVKLSYWLLFGTHD